jgi:hypothetical protein
MESNVYVIVKVTNVVHGPGDYEAENVLAYSGWDTATYHPAFTTLSAANRYLDGVKYRSGLRVEKLELRDE